MEKRIIITLILLLSVATTTFCATVHFYSDVDIEVGLYRPIDKMYNAYYVSDRLAIKPDQSVSCQFNIEDFCFVKLSYPGGRNYIIILQSNDELSLYYKDGKIVCEGSNSAGISYLNNKFIAPGLRRYSLKIDSIFDQNIKNGISCPSIMYDLDVFFSSDKTFSAISALEENEEISHCFATILQRDLQYALYSRVLNNYFVLLSGKMIQVNSIDSIQIKNQIDSIYLILSPEDKQIVKFHYGHSYANQYLNNIYKNLSSIDKDKLLNGYDENTFGPFVNYLLASDSVQLSYFGSAFLVQLDFLVNEFNKDKMLIFLENRFPKSQYFAIIKQKMGKLLQEQQEENKPPNTLNTIIMLDDSVNSLQDLAKTEKLKKKYLYIDIWATWCLPCKAEFAFIDDLHALLCDYANLVPVYLSIDEEQFEDYWQQNIQTYKLKGYHLRASKNLIADIKEKLYDNKVISIPKYILLDPNGNVISEDLSRPRDIDNHRFSCTITTLKRFF